MTMHQAMLSLGSNMGDRMQNLQDALRMLEQTGVVESMSGVYETEPVGFDAQDDFLNMVVDYRTPLAPADLLDRLLAVEKSLGRDRREKWGPRTIDIDILLYDDEVINDPHLTIPHPYYHERRFVLVPLVEIAPERVCPVRKVTMKQLLELCKDRHRIRPWTMPMTAIMNEETPCPIHRT